VGIKNAEMKIAIDATTNFCIIRILNYNTTKHYLFRYELDLMLPFNDLIMEIYL